MKNTETPAPETSPRWRIVGTILVLFLILWIAVGMQLSIYVGLLETRLWNAIMTLIALFAFLTSLSTIKPATMILSTFMGAIDGLDARKGRTTRGIGGSHIVLNFPYPFAQAIILPMGVFTVPFKPINATTKEVLAKKAKGEEDDTPRQDFTPVIALVQFTVQLPTNLEKMRRIIEVIDFLSARETNDLTGKTRLTFYRPKENAAGVEITAEDCFRIAKIFSTLLQPTIDEALSQVIALYPISTALQNRPEIEKAFINQLKSGANSDGSTRQGSIIERAGLLDEDEELYFNLNLVDISIADPDTAKALSAGTKERYNAQGAVEKARGEKEAEITRSEGAAKSVRNRADAVREGGPAAVQVLAAQAISDAASKNATFVAGLGLLDAGAAAIVKQSSQQQPKTDEAKTEKPGQ